MKRKGVKKKKENYEISIVNANLFRALYNNDIVLTIFVKVVPNEGGGGADAPRPLTVISHHLRSGFPIVLFAVSPCASSSLTLNASAHLLNYISL